MSGEGVDAMNDGNGSNGAAGAGEMAGAGTGTPPIIACQRHRFDIPDDIAYLNCAYMGPLSHAVMEAGERGVRAKSRPWSIAPSDFFDDSERARELFARLIGADADGVAFIPAASYALSCAARNLSPAPGQRILTLADQFPSHVYVWRELARATDATVVTLARPEDDDWTRVVLDAIDERTAIAALPNCHWTDGGRLDLVRIGARCREVGARLVLDITQSAGALPFDAAAVRPDFVACPGYKWLLGPYSLGFLWVAPEHRDGKPLEYNWIARAGSQDFARLVDYRDDYQPGARRFDVGERSNFALMPMLNAALEQLFEWGVEAIAATLAARTAAIAGRAAGLGLGSVPPGLRAGHFLGLRFPGGELPPRLLETLAEERVFVSVRGASMRVTPHVYNHDEDVDRLFGALERVLG